jgi:hypothetical protein
MIAVNEQSKMNALRRQWLMWLGSLPALSAATAIAVVSGGNLLRGLMLSGALWLMALPLLSSLEAGLLAMMIFEPLRGFLRRAQFIFVEYTTTDPIHLVTPLLTVLAFTILLWKKREQIFVTKPLGLPISILAACFFIQIFNPFQGGVFVGLSGAFFILLPVSWFFFGRAMKPAFLTTALRLIVVMGLICSLHGAYQLIFGFPSFEQYWVNHTDHYESIAVGHIQRSLATFNSAEEWGRYVQFGALISFGFAFGAKQIITRLGWIMCLAGLGTVLIITGQRTAIFGLVIGVTVFILLGAENWVVVIRRCLLMALPVVVLSLVAKPPSANEMWEKDKDDKFGTMLSHTTRGTLQPTKEGSLDERFRIWGILMTKIVPARPLGTGISAGTVASARYADVTSELYPIDSFIAVLLVGCSLPVALLFVGILVRIQWIGVRVYKSGAAGTHEAIVRRIAAAIISMLILNSFFGLTFLIYSAAPIAWMVIGWICSEAARDEQSLTGKLSPGV